jgi:hypothetical protein
MTKTDWKSKFDKLTDCEMSQKTIIRKAKQCYGYSIYLNAQYDNQQLK